MERKEHLEKREERVVRREKPADISGKNFALGVIGGIALVGIAALLVATFPDLKRYYKISTM
jgi:hypothetical protein